jgi:hypothetical protein
MQYLNVKNMMKSLFNYLLNLKKEFFIKFRLTNESESINEDDLDEAEKEYNRLVPEYNHLIEYLKTISEKFTLLEQDFNEEQVCFII